MKKTILLFLFILPVIIVLLILAIVGFVGRTLLVIPIENVSIDPRIFSYNQNFHMQGDTNNLILFANVGDSVPFMDFVIVEPMDATTALGFDISNPDAISIDENGRIVVSQNMRTSDPATGIELTLRYGEQIFFSVFIEIAIDNTRFDYFGFDFGLFGRGVSQENWHIDYALGIDYTQQLAWFEYRNDYDYVDVWHILIGKDYIDEAKNYTLPIKTIVERGFNIAPTNLLNYGTTLRNDFLASLTFDSSNAQILELYDNHAIIHSVGEVYVTVTTSFLGVNLSIVVPIVIT